MVPVGLGQWCARKRSERRKGTNHVVWIDIERKGVEVGLSLKLPREESKNKTNKEAYDSEGDKKLCERGEGRIVIEKKKGEQKTQKEKRVEEEVVMFAVADFMGENSFDALRRELVEKRLGEEDIAEARDDANNGGGVEVAHHPPAAEPAIGKLRLLAETLQAIL